LSTRRTRCSTSPTTQVRTRRCPTSASAATRKGDQLVASRFTAFGHHVDAELPQELGGGGSADLDNHVVVGESQFLLVGLEEDVFRPDAHDLARHERPHLAGLDGLVDAPAVLGAAAGERVATVADGDGRAAAEI